MLAETAVAVEGPLAKSNGVDVMDGEAGGKKKRQKLAQRTVRRADDTEYMPHILADH